jgi:hypothetical protein
MTPAQHMAFSRRLGPPHVMEPLEFNLPEWPEVFVVSNVEENGRPVGLRRAGWGWHSDGEDKAIPNAGSFLYALEVPPEGGDMLFADTYGAFAALPEDVRRVIKDRRACFSRVRLHHVHYPHMAPLTDEQKATRPDVWHPIGRARHVSSGGRAVADRGRGSLDGPRLVLQYRTIRYLARGKAGGDPGTPLARCVDSPLGTREPAWAGGRTESAPWCSARLLLRLSDLPSPWSYDLCQPPRSADGGDEPRGSRDGRARCAQYSSGPRGFGDGRAGHS